MLLSTNDSVASRGSCLSTLSNVRRSATRMPPWNGKPWKLPPALPVFYDGRIVRSQLGQANPADEGGKQRGQCALVKRRSSTWKKPALRHKALLPTT